MDDSSPSRSPGTASPQSTRQLLDELDALMQRMLALPVETREAEASAAPPRTGPSPYTVELAPSPAEAMKPVPPRVQVLEVGAIPAPAPEMQNRPHLLPSAPTLQPPPGESGLPARRAAINAAPSLQPPPELPEGALELLNHRPSAEASASKTKNPLVPMALPRRQSQPVSRVAGTKIAPPAAPAPLPPAKPIWINPATTSKTPAPQANYGVLGGILRIINWVFDLVTVLLGPLGGWLRGEGGRGLIGWCGILMLLGAAAWAAILFLG